MNQLKSYIDSLITEYWGVNVKKFMFAPERDIDKDDDGEDKDEDLEVRDYDPKNPYDTHSKMNNVSKTHPSVHIKSMNRNVYGDKLPLGSSSHSNRFPGGKNQSIR
jgi:hypothetical protein